MFPVALAAALAVAAVLAALLAARERRRRRRLGERVARHIEPYLRRKAAEAGLPASAPVWTARALPEEVVDYSAELAETLLARERSGPEPPPEADTDPALARTVPLRPPDDEETATTAKTRRRG